MDGWALRVGRWGDVRMRRRGRSDTIVATLQGPVRLRPASGILHPATTGDKRRATGIGARPWTIVLQHENRTLRSPTHTHTRTDH